MEVITTLLSQFSVEAIIILVITLVLAIKVVSDLFEWAYNKLKHYFDIKDEQTERHEEIMKEFGELKKENKIMYQDIQHLKELDTKFSNHEQDFCELKKIIDTQIVKFTDLETQVKILNERTQDATRAYIMDKYNHYVVELGAIDLAALQDIERRFSFYKAAGGDTFIDGMMEEIRELPRVTVEQLAAKQSKGGQN